MKRRVLAVILSAALLGSEFSFIPESISLRPSYALAQTPSEAEVTQGAEPEPQNEEPTGDPTQAPTETPSGDPTQTPTEIPSGDPTQAPTETPSGDPTQAPTELPSDKPTAEASVEPTAEATVTPESDEEEDELFTEGYALVLKGTRVYQKRSLEDGSVMGRFAEDGYVYAEERYGEGDSKDWMKILFAAEIGNKVSIEEGYLYACDLEELSDEETDELIEGMIEEDDTEMTDDGVMLEPVEFNKVKAKATAEPVENEEPTAEPTTEVSAEPTTEVSAEPTTEVSAEPTTEVSAEPTTEVSAEPTTEVTAEPTTEATVEPTVDPTLAPNTTSIVMFAPDATPYYVVKTIELTAEPAVQTPAEAEDAQKQTDGLESQPEEKADDVQTPDEAAEDTAVQTPDEAAQEDVQTPAEALPEATPGEATPGEATPGEAMPAGYYTCGMIEHAHDETCYDAEGNLICTLPEHTHDETCVVDYETAEDWEATFADIELTDDLRANVVAIARSQLGYTESELNYIVDSDGTKHGYTRYGQWHGTPYAEWCAIFASFCLYYGGVEGIPNRASTVEWQADFESLGLFADASDYIPQPGDIAFIDTDADGKTDHVAIVETVDENAVFELTATPDEASYEEEAEEEEELVGVMTVITGNVNRCVQRVDYALESEKIIGYGMLPVESTYVYSDEELYVEVKLPAGSTVPADAALCVTAIDESSEEYAAYVAQAEEAVNGPLMGIALYDISFYTADGEYYPVSDKATVTMAFAENPIATDSEADVQTEVQVLHFENENAVPEVLGGITFGEKNVDMILEGVQKALEDPQAAIDELENQIAGTPLDNELTGEVLGALSTFAMSREGQKAAAAAKKAISKASEHITLSPADGTAAAETTREKRTVVEFTTPGFSVFAVVQVEGTAINGDPIYSNITSILDADMIGSLDGLSLMISVNGANGTTYALTQVAQNVASGNTNYNHLAGHAVARGDKHVAVGSADELPGLLWKFEAANDPDVTNDYYISIGGKYLNINTGNQTASVEDGKKQVLYVNAASDEKGSVAVMLRVANADGRGLGFNTTNNANTFTSYNSNVAQLVLSVPTVETTVITDPTVDGINNDHPLAGKIIAISTANDMILNDAAGVNADVYTGYRGVVSKEAAVGDQLMSINAVRDDNKAYVADNMVWKFTAVNGQDETYYIQAYDLKTKTAGDYLQLPGGAKLALTPNKGKDNGTQIQVEIDNNNNLLLKRSDANRRAAFDAEHWYFTSFETPGNRGYLTLSEYTEAAIVGNVVTDLADQVMGIVNISAKQAVSGNLDEDGLKGVDVIMNDDADPTDISIPDDAENVRWVFEAVNASAGIYNIKLYNGTTTGYLNISDRKATVSNEPQNITVIKNGDKDSVYLYSGGQYLNDFGGDKNNYFAGWDTDNDPGSLFYLVREYAYKARILSRAELRESALAPGAEIVIFVRQTDENGAERYYAMTKEGRAVEVFLQGDLAQGDYIYATTTAEDLRWDATGSPKDGWNTSNDVNGAIDLWAKSVDESESTGGVRYISPNGDGGYGNVNAADENYVNPYRNTLSITSAVETEANWGWFIDKGVHDRRINMPLRAKHNASFYKIADNSLNTINRDLASVIVSDLAYTDQTFGSCMVTYDAASDGFVAKDFVKYDEQKTATDDTAFYVALIETNNLLIGERHDNLVGQILTREEFRDAAKEYGALYPFIVFTKAPDGNLYAIDGNGNAQPIHSIDGHSLEAGDRIIFANNSDTYNSNLLLWDPMFTDFNTGSNKPGDAGWVDLTLRNMGSWDFLSPHANNLFSTFSPETVAYNGGRSLGFFYINDNGFDNEIASYMAARLGEAKEQCFKVKYDPATGKFISETEWGGDGTSLGNFDCQEGYDFYVAMLVDWGVTVEGNYSVKEYKTFSGVEENVKMYVFNYGSAIDYLGQTYNGTVIKNEDRAGYPDLYEYGTDLAYRFFYRHAFQGEAMDCTNDPNGSEMGMPDTQLYANSDPIQGDDLKVLPTLQNGYPALENPTSITTNNGYYYSLEYLFRPNGFETNPNATGVNADYYNLTLYDNSVNSNLHEITPEEAEGTQINQVNGKTVPAAGYEPVMNPNYAMMSYAVGDGVSTGLFQKDSEGYYFYDSKANAAYFNGTKFELYNYALLPGGYINLEGGNFLPMNDGNAQARRVDESKLNTGGATIRPDSIAKAKRYYQMNGFMHDDDVTIGRKSMADLWVGMYMELDFSMTEDGEIGIYDEKGRAAWENADGTRYYLDESNGTFYDANGNVADGVTQNGLTEIRNDLIFSFAGDDDVLVYVDDVLLLDLKGIHGVIPGSINFASGKITGGANEGKTIAELFSEAEVNGEIDGDTFTPSSDHTLKFYYLERGGNISDCAISFNLELKPKAGLSVTKRVEGLDENDPSFGIASLAAEDEEIITYDQEYTFQLVDIVQTYDPTGGDVTSVPYTIQRNDRTVESGNLALKRQVIQIDGEEYYCNRFYPKALDEPTDQTFENVNLTDGKYIAIYEKKGDAEANKYFFYNKENVLTSANDMGLVNTSYNDHFYRVYDSETFTLESAETAHFNNFIVGSLVSVKEYPPTTGVGLDSNYWWQITDTGTGEQEGTGVYEGVGSAETGFVSQPFTIVQDKLVEVVCRNVLLPVNLGIRKLVVDANGNEIDSDVTFNIKYTLTYPTSDYFGMEGDALYEYNLEHTRGDLLRETYTGTWTLKSGETYGKIVDTKNGLNNTSFTSDAANDEQYFQWTVNIPFGSVVKIEEISAADAAGNPIPLNFYETSWSYEGKDGDRTAVATDNITIDGVTYQTGETLSDDVAAKVLASNENYVSVYDESRNETIIVRDVEVFGGVTLEAGQVIAGELITNLPAPFKYQSSYATVNSASGDGTTISSIPLLNMDNYVTIINEQKTADVKITKTVVGGNNTDTFTFTATATDMYGKALTLPATDASFTLKNGESKTISGLPIGAIVTVTETDRDDYKEFFTMKASYEAEYGTVSGTESGAAVAVKNTNASNGEHVGNIKGANWTVSIPVVSNAATGANMKIWYCSAQDRTFSIQVNGTEIDSAQYGNLNNGSWSVMKETDQNAALSLAAITNTITFGGVNDSYAPNLDKIQLTFGSVESNVAKINLLGDGAEINFSNEPVTSVTVKKTIEGGDTTGSFGFNAVLKDADGAPITSVVNGSGETLTSADGTYTFQLGHDGTYTFKDLPVGATVQVKETEVDDYLTSYEVYTRCEAEDGVNNTGEVRTQNATTHSGGAYVGNWDGGGSATYTFDSPVTGKVKMRIYGCSGENRALVVTINDQTLNVDTVSNSSWDTTNGFVLATVEIPVIEGENTMVVAGPAAAKAPNVDCFDIIWTDEMSDRKTEEIEALGQTIHFINTVTYTLPSTGGTGTLPYILSGWLLLLAAAGLMMYNQKRYGKEGKRT